MKTRIFHGLALGLLAATAVAQPLAIRPQIRSKISVDRNITAVELIAHFVTAIRVPEPINSVVVGDPALFQVEHSEAEPELVFVKALGTQASQSNLLISTTRGHQISLLLISHGPGSSAAAVDFLLRYQNAGGFLIEPDADPFALVAATTTLSQPARNVSANAPPGSFQSATGLAPTAIPELSEATPDSLERLLVRQKHAPLPVLYGEHMEAEEGKGEPLRAGISEVIDGGQQVILLFSIVNTSKHAILLMPPQVQLGGRERSGKLIRHRRWSTAEPLTVLDWRLSERRISPGGRADGVLAFERPPYKRSTESLFLQMAESGEIDKPALVPIGFGVNTAREAIDHAQ